MKKFILIFVVLLLVVIGLLAFVAKSASPITSWRTFEQQFPAALKHADYIMLSLETEGSDQVPLPLGIRLRQALRPEPRVKLVVSGFPEAVQQYVLESVPSHLRFHCLVRYTGGKVACAVIRYPAGAKPEALRLRDALRQTFQGGRVSVHEINARLTKASNPAGASWLQSLRPVRRVAELGSLPL